MGHIDDVRRSVLSTWPRERWFNVRTLVAVSGGLDSIALLRVLISLHEDHAHLNSTKDPRNNLIVAHFNHQTRGLASDEDENFVRSLCQRMSVKFVSKTLNTATSTDSEENLRRARYQFLEQTAINEHARYIATGHHADDQIETVLFRIIRGTGLAGLSGIPQFRQLNEHVSLVRPLLQVARAKLEALLEELEQPYCSDVSNDETTYSRNFLRHNIVPLLQQKFANHLPGSILRLAEQAAEIESYLEQVSQPLFGQINFDIRNGVDFDADILKGEHPVLIKALLRRIWQHKKWPQQSMGSQWWNQISNALIAAKDDSLNLPANVQLRIVRRHVTFKKENTKASESVE